MTIRMTSSVPRVVFIASRLAELTAALHVLMAADSHDAQRALLQPIKDLGAELVNEISRSQLLWVSGRADFLLPSGRSRDLAQELDDIDRLSDEEWVAAALAVHRATGSTGVGSPLVDPDARRLALELASARGPAQRAWAWAVLNDPMAARSATRVLIETVDEVWFAPAWERIAPVLQGEVAERQSRLAEGGCSSLNDISPVVRWDDDRRTLVLDKLQDVYTTGGQLTLVPTILGAPHYTVVHARHLEPVVQYPLRHDPMDGVDELESRLAALAHPTRLRLCRTLGRGWHTTGELAARWTLTDPQVSRHLAVLRSAGLIVTERRGKFVLHKLEVSRLEGLGVLLLDVISR